MQKIKIIVDSPCDIPNDGLAQYDIEMVGVPIIVDGKEYIEQEDFSCEEFYSILGSASSLPTTSRVPMAVFADKYHKYWEEGSTDIIVITMNGGGSGTHESAHMAARRFFEDRPEATGRLSIHIVDSRSYSLGYGYPAMVAASMAREGIPIKKILKFLKEVFSQIEILLVCYNLEYARKSGRITAAAAVMGDVLGVRPIIEMIDGKTKITSKVRGDKQATKKLLDLYRERRESPETHILVASAAVSEHGEALKKQLEQELGRNISHYKVGAAITINTGPNMVALCYLGKQRKQDGIMQSSIITYDGITEMVLGK